MDAVTWVDRERAIVALRTGTEPIDVIRFDLPAEDVARTAALANVVHAIGERDHVVVMGPEPERTRLEREYVAIYRRPDRLRDAEPGTSEVETSVVERLRELTSA
jgi:hypothetical protein